MDVQFGSSRFTSTKMAESLAYDCMDCIRRPVCNCCIYILLCLLYLSNPQGTKSDGCFVPYRTSIMANFLLH